MSDTFLRMEADAENWIERKNIQKLMPSSFQNYEYKYKHLNAYVTQGEIEYTIQGVLSAINTWSRPEHVRDLIERYEKYAKQRSSINVIFDRIKRALYSNIDIEEEAVKFAVEKDIFDEIYTTLDVYKTVFGEYSRYDIYMREDPESEDSKKNRFVVFEIRFEGDPQEFRRRYKLFIKQWLGEIPDNHQEYIDFAFHING